MNFEAPAAARAVAAVTATSVTSEVAVELPQLLLDLIELFDEEAITEADLLVPRHELALELKPAVRFTTQLG